MPPSLLLIFAFGFSSLAMLGWLTVVAAPLLIHLWNKKKYRETTWAAMTFLLAAIQQSARRMRLHNLLLLLVRTLLILLMVLAVAGPQFDSWYSQKQIHHVLVLDCSLSMSYQENNEPILEKAKQKAIEVVRSGNSYDLYSLVTLTGHEPNIIVEHDFSSENIIRQIKLLKPSAGQPNIRSCLTRLNRLLDQIEKRYPHFKQHQITLVTDLDAAYTPLLSKSISAETPSNSPPPTTFKTPRQPIAAATQTEQAVTSLLARARLSVLTVTPRDSDNLSITEVKTSRPYFIQNVADSLQITIHNSNRKTEKSCQLALMLEGEILQEQTVKIPAQQSQTLRLELLFDRLGTHSLQLKIITEDSLTNDNSHYLVATVLPEIRILCVAGKPDAARYIARAINPSFPALGALQPTIIPEGQLEETKLTEYATIFFSNVSQFTTAETRRIRQYLQTGGSVVFFLGDQVNVENYNAQLGLSQTDLNLLKNKTAENLKHKSSPQSASTATQEPEQNRGQKFQAILPARLQDLITGPFYSLDPLGYPHPITSFKNQGRSGLLTTPVRCYIRLQPNDPRSTITAAQFPNGDPFLISHRYGPGRVYLFSTAGAMNSIDKVTGEPWTLMPTWNSFLPLIQEMIAGILLEQRHRSSYHVEERLFGTCAVADFPHLQMITPDNSSSRPTALSPSTDPGFEEKSLQKWVFGPTKLPGIYRLESTRFKKQQPLDLDSVLADTRLNYFAVNTPVSESLLQYLSADQLDSKIKRVNASSTNSPFENQAVSHGLRLHRLLIYLAVVLFLIESFLTWNIAKTPPLTSSNQSLFNRSARVK